MVIPIRRLFWIGGILLLLTLLGIGLWLYLRPSEEKQIRERFNRLSALAFKNGKEGAIPAIRRAGDAASLFSDQSTFQVDGLEWMAGPFTREALSSNIFRSRAMFTQIKLSFDDLELEIDPENKTAKVFLSAVLSGKLKDGRTIREIRELESLLKKTEEGWLFEKFKIREIIKK